MARTLGAQEHEPGNYVLLVFSNPVAGQEDAYNRWYDNQHAPDVVAVPGFITAQRFVLSGTQLRVSKPLPKYLIVYKIVTSDLPSVYAEVNRRVETRMTVMDPSFDKILRRLNFTYKVIGPVIYNKGPAGTHHPGSQIYNQLVFADPVPGKEDEFNRWYDNQHEPDVVAAPGFVSAQRYVVSGTQLGDKQPPTQYFVMYKIVSGDLAADFAEYARRAPKMQMSSAFGESFGYTYKAHRLGHPRRQGPLGTRRSTNKILVRKLVLVAAT